MVAPTAMPTISNEPTTAMRARLPLPRKANIRRNAFTALHPTTRVPTGLENEVSVIRFHLAAVPELSVHGCARPTRGGAKRAQAGHGSKGLGERFSEHRCVRFLAADAFVDEAHLSQQVRVQQIARVDDRGPG